VERRISSSSKKSSAGPHKLALPIVSKGKQKLKIPAKRYSAAETKIGVSENPTYVAIIGAISPQIRLNADAIPVPVPRWTEGITSGV
jgi:hypothetical protein